MGKIGLLWKYGGKTNLETLGFETNSESLGAQGPKSTRY
jgi:hypothetical protein